MTSELSDTWYARDLPVLRIIAANCDDPDGNASLPIESIPDLCDFDIDSVKRAATALYHADPPYITGIDIGELSWPLRATGLTERGRRAVGSWPTTEKVSADLIAALERTAEAETDPERKSRVTGFVSYLQGPATDLLAKFAVEFIARQAGL